MICAEVRQESIRVLGAFESWASLDSFSFVGCGRKGLGKGGGLRNTRTSIMVGTLEVQGVSWLSARAQASQLLFLA